MSTSILLTGATGFAGSHLARALVADGHDVTILCRSFSDTGRIADILGNVRRIDMDKVALPEAIAALNLAGVVHLATDYGRFGTRASDVFRTNFLLPVELLEIVIAHGGPDSS
jgi:CDP-paratose synthetase